MAKVIKLKCPVCGKVFSMKHGPTKSEAALPESQLQEAEYQAQGSVVKNIFDHKSSCNGTIEIEGLLYVD